MKKISTSSKYKSAKIYFLGLILIHTSGVWKEGYKVLANFFMIFNSDKIKRYYHLNTKKNKSAKLMIVLCSHYVLPSQLNFEKLTQAVVLIFGDYLLPENFAFE